MHQRLQYNWHKWLCVVIVQTVYLGVFWDLGVDVWLFEEQEFLLCLGYWLEPYVYGESRRRPNHYANEVILPCLNCLLCQVVKMIIWRHELEIHVGWPDLLSVRRQYFVVDYLVLFKYALVPHSVQFPAPGQDHFPLRLFFHWFNPGGFSIYFVQDYLIFIPPDWSVRELPCLVRVYCLLGIVHV